jgi:hypothetical protein
LKRCRNIKTFERAILAPRLCCEVTDYANSPQPLVSLFRDSGAVTIDSGIIVAVGHSRHEHDKKTLDSDIEQITKLRNFALMSLSVTGDIEAGAWLAIRVSLFPNRQVRK